VTILVVDYGVSNLLSVTRALENAGCVVRVSGDPDAISDAERIVLPGVGSFAEAMTQLHQRELVYPLRRAVIEGRVPLLGICLGMQLLADRGFEVREIGGLGFVRGKVVRLEPQGKSDRVPHVGWNEVALRRADQLFDHVKSGTDFYFAHSYQLVAEDEKDVLAVCDYCGGVTAAVRKENVFGVQFHPEKSAEAGAQILKNFLDA